jgi:hypothetical protein
MTLLDRALRIGGAGAMERRGVVAAVYLAHATLALALAWPIARIAADPTLSYPRGDRILFEPGGLYLSEALRLARAPLTSAAEGMSFGILVGLYLGLLPLGALLYALARREPMSLSILMGAAGRTFGPLSLLLGLALVVTALACTAPLTVASLLETKLTTALGDRGSDIAEAGFRVVALGVAAFVGVVHDLARAALVSCEERALRAARIGVETLRLWPAEALGGWALRALSALLLVTVVARTTTYIGVETGPRFIAVVLLHQAVAAALVFLRADWLALANRLVGSSYRSDL